MLAGDIPTPLLLAPAAAGMRGTLCADGTWSQWRWEDLTADDLAAPRYGATPSNMKLFSGDFDGDGRPDLLLQAGDRIRHSLLLALDARAAPRVLRNLRRALSAVEYPRLDIADLNHNGRADIVAISASGQPVMYVDGDAAGDPVPVANTVAALAAPTFNVSLAGSMEGRFKVDERGAATYELGILAARGTAGVTPRISLNYSSSDGDGVAGPGWSIGGLSAITRCRQTPAQDNNSTAIGLNGDDRFCLDGQRLILITGVYGGNGSIYRTELDSYAVITAYGYFNGHPLYFTVQRKDGSLSYYGDGPLQGSNRSAPVVNVGGATLTWAISRFQDSVGNAIRFQYSSNGTTNEHLISRIDYAYGANAGNSGNSSTYLQFNYQLRADGSSGYVAGVKIARTQRLASIRSVSDGVELRSYHLVYRTPDGGRVQSFVEKIYECVGSECIAPTTFDWQLNRGGFAPVQALADEAGAKLSTLRVLDINGDGRSDLLYRRLSSPYPVSYRLSNAIGFGAAIPLLASTVKSTNVDDADVAIFDLNGDGRQDLLHVQSGAGVHKGTLFLGGVGGFGGGTAYDPGMGLTVAADIDGDGLPDLAGTNLIPMYRRGQRLAVDGLWSTVFGAPQPLLGDANSVPGPPPGCNLPQAFWYLPAGLLADGTDFNGDGRVDFAAQVTYSLCKTSHAGAAISHGNGNFSTLGWTAGIAMPSADMNGDGLADQWYDDAVGGRQLRFSTGTAFTAPLRVGSAADLERAVYLDYNGDGFPDLLWPSIYGVLVVQLFNPATESYGAPTATSVPYQPASATLAADRYLPVDMDGDGHADLLRINHNPGGSSLTLYRSIDVWGAGNRINRIDNGVGSSTAITYKPLTDGSVYTAGSDARNVGAWPGAPVFDITAPHYVVAKVSTTAPTAHPAIAGAVNSAATRGTSYRYSGLKLQSGGRGSLGFASIKTTDEQTGIVSSTFYQQQFPFIGRPLITVVSSAGGGAIKTTIVTASQIVRNGIGGGRYYQIYDSVQDECNFDPVSGVEVGFTQTQNSTPDEWGNIPLTAVSRYPVDSHTAFLTRTLTFNSYGETIYTRRFGRVDTTLVLHQRAGEPDIGRTSTFTYNPAGSSLEGLLATESIGAMGDEPIRTLSYQYDRFGNRQRTTADASSNTSRYEETIFDAAGRFATSRRGEFFDGSNWVPRVIESVLGRNAYGQPTRLQRLNGLIVSYGYDVLGREIRRSENTGALAETRYIRGGVNGPQYQVVTTAATGAVSTEYVDALGRSMMKGELGFDGRWIYRETEYDSLGRIKRQSAPHYGGDAVYWTTNNYDAFRLQSRIEPAAGGNVATTSISYNGLATTTTNSLGQRRVEVRNAAGELVQSIDELGGTVSYSYDAAGQVRLVTTTALREGRSITARTVSVYDPLGRKIKMVDADRGTSFYVYNGFDELLEQYQLMATGDYGGTLIQALGTRQPMQRTSMRYDRRGRMIQRDDYRVGNVRESAARWQYDTQDHGVGRLAEDFIEGQSVGHQYGYDSYGRLVARLTANDDYYLEEVTYDAVGRVATLTDAVGSDSGTRNIYNATGYLASIEDLATGVALYRVHGRDARGHVTDAVLGSGAIGSWSYDGGSGHLLEQTTQLGKASLQKLAYTWDALGNPTSRWDRGALAPVGTKNLQQSFCYDGLNRLLKTHQDTLNGSCALDSTRQDQQYDGLGNIVRKTGIGAFSYDEQHPFRLQGTADGARYTYDAIGNVATDSSGRALDYTVFDKPSSIRRAGQRIDFSYGVGRELRKRVDKDSGTGETTTTHRIGSVEKISRADGSHELRRYIGGVAIWSYRFDRKGVQTGLDRQYLHTDAQGTPVLLTSDTGALKQQFAYDPWGRRVWANNPAMNLPAASFLPVSTQRTTMGFTGHDMLDAVGLVHMQGRVYDPRLGRFLQADPFVQAPGYLQSFNRYSYVFNAPLRFTDPTGFNGAGDDAVTLGSSLGNSWGNLLPTVYVSGAGYSNAYTSFDAGNGYGMYNGLVDFSFGNAVAATPKALSLFSIVGAKSAGEQKIAGDGFRQQQLRKKSAELGEAFLPGDAADDDTRMDCSTGVCYVTVTRDIYLTGHRVRGVGPFHTALEYDNGAGIEWISAGFDGYTSEGMNRLVSEVGSVINQSRPGDAPWRNVALGRVIPPPGLSTDEYFLRLKEVSQSYRNLADYDLFPGIADGYNSNSYIRGLLDVTGGTSTVDLGGFVGGEKPLPAHYFLRR
jgi:RHS repeat-associated protein